MLRIKADDMLQDTLKEFMEKHPDAQVVISRDYIYVSGCLCIKMQRGEYEIKRPIRMYDAERYSGHPWLFAELLENLYLQAVDIKNDTDR